MEVPRSCYYEWSLPLGDVDFSNRWKIIKTHFSKGLPKDERRSRSVGVYSLLLFFLRLDGN